MEFRGTAGVVAVLSVMPVLGADMVDLGGQLKEWRVVYDGRRLHCFCRIV